MIRCRLLPVVVGALVVAGAAAQAQSAMPGQPVPTHELAEQVCAACHGADGNSPLARYPSLAGQFAPYLERQLQAFAAQGRQRASGVMGAIAVNLSADEMRRLADHFSHQPLRPPRTGTAALFGVGEAVYFGAAAGRDVGSCASCHGVRGEGLADVFPRLAGQQAAYLADQLRQFRAGTRRNDPGAMMRRVAAHLSDTDIAAVAAYLAADAALPAAAIAHLEAP